MPATSRPPGRVRREASAAASSRGASLEPPKPRSACADSMPRAVAHASAITSRAALSSGSLWSPLERAGRRRVESAHVDPSPGVQLRCSKLDSPPTNELRSLVDAHTPLLGRPPARLFCIARARRLLRSPPGHTPTPPHCCASRTSRTLGEQRIENVRVSSHPSTLTHKFARCPGALCNELPRRASPLLEVAFRHQGGGRCKATIHPAFQPTHQPGGRERSARCVRKFGLPIAAKMALHSATPPGSCPHCARTPAASSACPSTLPVRPARFLGRPTCDQYAVLGPVRARARINNSGAPKRSPRSRRAAAKWPPPGRNLERPWRKSCRFPVDRPYRIAPPRSIWPGERCQQHQTLELRLAMATVQDGQASATPNTVPTTPASRTRRKSSVSTSYPRLAARRALDPARIRPQSRSAKHSCCPWLARDLLDLIGVLETGSTVGSVDCVPLARQ